MIARRALIVDTTTSVDAALATRPPQRATTTGHIIAAALPVVASTVLDEVRRLCVRSMTPAQIREVCDQIENQIRGDGR